MESENDVTGPAVPQSKSRRIAKCLWVLVIIVSVTGFSINFISVFRRYLQEPILTEINDEFADFVWPHITFCNPSNPIAFWKGPEVKKKWSIKKKSAEQVIRILSRNHMRVTEQQLLMSSISPSVFFEDGFRGFIYLVRVSSHFTQKIATSSQTYISYKKLKNLEAAFDDHLDSSKYPLPCYTLKPELFYGEDSARLKNLSAIKVYLILDTESYRIFNSGDENRKLYVYLTYPNDSLSSTVPIHITPGTSSNLQITETRLKRVKNCADHNLVVELYRVNQQSTIAFRGELRDCRFNISQRLYYERCKCQTPSLPIYKLSSKYPPLCTNMTLFNSTQILSNYRCIRKVQRQYDSVQHFGKLLHEKCSVYFKPRCNQKSYTLNRQTTNWPKVLNRKRGEMMKNFVRIMPNARVRKFIPKDFVRNNLAIVQFYRKSDKSVQTFDQFEYPISKFLSDVGGLLGLWLGLSVVGAYQIIQPFIVHGSSMIKRLRVKWNGNDPV